jgi:hypothetical protein
MAYACFRDEMIEWQSMYDDLECGRPNHAGRVQGIAAHVAGNFVSGIISLPGRCMFEASVPLKAG